MTEPNPTLPFIMVVVLTVGVTALLLSSHLLEITLPRGPAPKPSLSTPSRSIQDTLPATAMSATTATGEPAEVAETAPLASESRGLAVGARARVAHTDGLGVIFYAAPRDGARLPAGLLEGTMITVLGLSGEDWARVQSDGKQAGWVRAAYLAPAD
jgi:hypothetical protein